MFNYLQQNKHIFFIIIPFNGNMLLISVMICFVSALIPLQAQYDTATINYGIDITKNLGLASEAGIGLRLEYAHNCYTTYMAEYHYFSTFESEHENYHEVALGANLIMFNWYPTTITAGMGYIVNTSKAFEEIEDEAFIGIRTGNLNHGAQIKLRALHNVSQYMHLFTDLNIKTLGSRYHTFTLGLNYEF